MSHSKINRRQFVAAATGAVVAAPSVLRAQNPNNRLNIAVIGCGGRGAANLAAVSGENIVALCDVSQRAIDAAAAKFPKARRCSDFRQLFDHQREFDAVVVSTCEHTHAFATMLALRQMVNEVGNEMSIYGDLKAVPQDQTPNFRNNLYLVSEALRLMDKSGKPAFSADEKTTLANYKKHVDEATKFIPTWVKVAVAIALGLGTMVGWKRIVVTVGEKIGKTHLTYGQGAAAELVAMTTILAADRFGLPVSTTHVLSSGVAGTMAANGSGLQWSTVRALAMAWILTLPASIILSASLFWLFRQF